MMALHLNTQQVCFCFAEVFSDWSKNAMIIVNDHQQCSMSSQLISAFINFIPVLNVIERAT